MRITIQAMNVICDECGKKELREKWVPRDLNIPGWIMSDDGSDLCSDACKQIDLKRYILINSITNWEVKDDVL